MGIALIPLMCTLVLYLFITKDAPSQPPAKPVRDYFNVLKIKDTWYFCLLYCVTFGGFVGLTSFLSIFFVDQYHLPSVSAGNFVTLCVAAGSIVRPIGGMIADRIGGVRLLSYLLIGVTLCMLGVSQLPSLSVTTVLLFAGMSCLGMGNGAVFQLVPQRFKNEIGVITGIVGAAGGVGGFFVPIILGSLKELSGTYASGFIVYSLIGGFAFILLMVAQNAWKKTWALQKSSIKL